MTVYRPEVELTTPIMAWWTDNSNDTDFCIVPQEECGISFNLSYAEAKALYSILGQKLKGRTE